MRDTGDNLRSTIKRTRFFRYRGREIPSTVYETVLNLESDDLLSIEALCRDDEAIARACGFADASNTNGKNKVESAIYVIEVVGEAIAKIGISHCPVKRFDDLQAGCWKELRLHALAWSPTRRAGAVEQAALRAAREAGNGLRGEWVSLSATDAFQLVLRQARELKIPLADSAAWSDNWGSRIRGIVAGRKISDNFARRVA